MPPLPPLAVSREDSHGKFSFEDEATSHTATAFVMDAVLDMKDAVLDMKDAVLDECNEVREAFIEEFKDEEENFFLQMALTRGLSLLPNDVVEAAAVSSSIPEQEEDKAEQIKQSPGLSAYAVLAVAVISLSAIGPLLQLQDGVKPENENCFGDK